MQLVTTKLALCWIDFQSICFTRMKSKIPGPVFCLLLKSKLRLCSANHRPGYWSNLPCDWPSTAWAYSEQETENGPWSSWPMVFVNKSHPIREDIFIKQVRSGMCDDKVSSGKQCANLAFLDSSIIWKVCLGWLISPWTKWPPFWQKIFSHAFSWMKMIEFWFKFHWNLFLGVKLTISQHWFR